MANSPSASMGGTRKPAGLRDKETRHTEKCHETSHTPWIGRSVKGRKKTSRLKIMLSKFQTLVKCAPDCSFKNVGNVFFFYISTHF